LAGKEKSKQFLSFLCVNHNDAKNKDGQEFGKDYGYSNYNSSGKHEKSKSIAHLRIGSVFRHLFLCGIAAKRHSAMPVDRTASDGVRKSLFLKPLFISFFIIL